MIRKQSDNNFHDTKTPVIWTKQRQPPKFAGLPSRGEKFDSLQPPTLSNIDFKTLVVLKTLFLLQIPTKWAY